MQNEYCEIIQKGKKSIRIKNFLDNGITFRNELMYIPEAEITIPIHYKEYLNGRPEIIIHIDNIHFHGIVFDTVENKQDETIIFTAIHIIHEWYYREISTNLAVKDRTIEDLYNSDDFKYSSEWIMDISTSAKNRTIDYVYSRQKYLDALSKTVKLTDDLFWRVGFDEKKVIEIGAFGDKKQYTISMLPPSEQNLQILEEPIIRNNYKDVINVATVYGTKSDSGMSSMSLREVYYDKSLQDPNFPVIILRKGINNERDYDYVDYPELAPNNDTEYAIIDKESVALESGTLIEGTFSFDDLSPFNTEGKPITNDDRIKAAVTAYNKAKKILIEKRRDFTIEVLISELKPDIKVGDMIMLKYNNTIKLLGNCTNYMKKILSYNDWFYITEMEPVIDINGMKTARLRLDKFLRIEREGD